jgi:cyclic-di-GMP phosphodiesterase TipF (flagellum assembly factor)
MLRLSALFVAICMLLIAGAFGLVLYLVFGVSGAEASVVAVAALTCLAVYNAVSTRIRYQSELSGQLGDLSRGTADLARQVGEQGRRLAALEKSGDAAVQKAIAVAQPLQAELSELGALIKELARTLAAQEATLRSLAAQQSSAPLVPESVPPMGASPVGAPPLPQPLVTPSVADPAVAAPSLSRAMPAQPAGPFRGMPDDAIAALIRGAISDNRIEAYLQPIVTLPQRKVRYYEALMRLRLPDGQIVAAADFLGHAEAAGLMPSLDYLMVARCVRVLRRLQSKSRDIGVFCNLSVATLIDRDMRTQITDFAEANRVLAPVLIFELPYPALRLAGARENESVARLTDLGFKLSVDHVPDLRFDARDLADRRCGFMKIAASVLLDRNSQAAADIHPADIAGLLARNGVELIAEKIETEETVVGLLDFDLKLGQGNLFSPPRPVRPEGPANTGEAEEQVEPQTGAPTGAPQAPSDQPQPVGERSSTLARLARVVNRH